MIRVSIFLAFLCVVGVAVPWATGAGNASGRPDHGAADPLNATYRIEGEAVGLTDGRRETPAAPGSAIKVKTTVMGRPVFGDLDGDGDEDAVLLLIHDPGGSGTFFYVAASINVNGRYQGTNAILLGDRIAPTDIGICNGVAAVHYADRGPEKPMSADPSVDKTSVVTLQNGRLFEVAPEVDCTGGGVTIGSPTRINQKIRFDISELDEQGLFGPPGEKRALSYEFCIPDTVQNKAEVKQIDPTVTFFAESPGRIGCGRYESLCIGSTHQEDFAIILQRLAGLSYIKRIDQSFFE